MKLTVREQAKFAILGALMYASKVTLEALPNVHLLGVFTIALTLVYRKKALYPVLVYVLINGLFAGFAVWWIPYLYLWPLLWGVTMLLPQEIPQKIRPLVYMVVCALHGLLFGTLYAPAQALFYGMNLQQTLAWIVAGLPFDLIHGVSNFICGTLILPLAAAIRKADCGLAPAGHTPQNEVPGRKNSSGKPPAAKTAATQVPPKGASATTENRKEKEEEL